MDLKQQMLNKAMQVMQDPRVAKAMQNPKFIQGVMGALKLRSEMQKNLDAGVKIVAKRLNLATESEVRELKRAVKRLERELESERHTGGSRKGGHHKEHAED